MCGDCNNQIHDDLDDSLDVFGLAPLPSGPAAVQRPAPIPVPTAPTFVEKCPSCRGRGRFISYAGRDCGPCFKCKGKGELEFKTSSEDRAAARESAANRKARKLAEWIDEHQAEHAWIERKSGSFEFAANMNEALTKYGYLTENQLATVRRLCARDLQRDEERARERVQREAHAPAVDATAIHDAFAMAQSKGIKRPKMTLNGFKISLAPVTGSNAGALYVVRKQDDQYLGKIAGGVFKRVRECDATTEQAVVKVIADPKGEAIAYGQRTGECCICGRELTNHASIDAGIGPICASRFGW